MIVRSRNLDPFFNLAFEEYSHDHLAQSFSLLFFWRTTSAVVIGRFQNPFKECNPRVVLESGTVIARRISGGGAVYEDSGNLNYGFISSRALFDRAADFAVITRALSGIGIEAKVTESHAIEVLGEKISGNAFSLRRQGALHHGTMLVASDLRALESRLAHPDYTVTDVSVSSRHSKVSNLSAFAAKIGVDDVRLAIAEEWKNAGSAEDIDPEELIEPSVFAPYLERIRKPAWTYGFPSDFQVELPCSDTKKGSILLTKSGGRLKNPVYMQNNSYTEIPIWEIFEYVRENPNLSSFLALITAGYPEPLPFRRINDR
jgi:lipoate---protein ligase